ncbi:MAG: Hsp20/alpha crystallin family protein [Nitrospinota bacterium]|nr:Hsp20/alpha crystallin family protein [Nitrospinota bacterium]MDH5755501.1 Hsp20/alpha crystallin family protein [Nitrospinota bacterium]
MGSEGKKKPIYRADFSYPTSMEHGVSEMREPSELVGETRFIPMDVYENDQGLIVELDLPGGCAEDISVTIQDLWLVIEGIKRDIRDVKEKAAFLCSERSFGPFKRVFKISMAVDLDMATSTYHRGGLQVVLPKLSDRRKRIRKIKVTTTGE